MSPTRAATFLPGVNYPWTMFQGRANYGCDFGVNIWGGHSGVTAHREDVRQDLADIAAMGASIARWFVFTDGRGGIDWDSRHEPRGLADRFFDDMDAALQFSTDAGVRLCLVLFDYAWMTRRECHESDARAFARQPALLAEAAGRRRLIDVILRPFLTRYGRTGPHRDLGHAIHSIDIMNEPDWVTTGLSHKRSRRCRPFSRGELGRFVRMVGDEVHAALDALVTVGGGRVRHAAEWTDPALALDFVQIHSYPDVRHPRRDRSLIGCPARALTSALPIVIGECPANGDRAHPPDHHPPPLSLTDYLDLGLEGGYLGVWPWSFKGVDAFGAVDAGAMRRWCTRRILPPTI